MIRIVSLTVAGLLALAGVAIASHKGAKTYKADLDPVAAGATAPTGKAKLVDSKKNNKVTVHVKGLTPGTTYEWHVHPFAAGVTDPCAPGATQGPIDTRFAYGALTANEAGNASAKGKSTTFDWGTAQYYVNIHMPPGAGPPIACGVLSRKGPQGEAKGHG
jgi:Cu/Zn superoxide dismutase